jgi:cullin 3
VYNGRRLTWQTNLGTAELRCKFHKGRKELVVPTFQMCILMLYNHGDVFTFRQIQELTRISEAELGRHLLSLAHPKVHILVKTPNTRALADDHKFSYNMAFTSKLFRIKVPVMSQSVAAAAVKAEVPEAVMEARKNRVEAAIVRVMKSRKTLDHNNLVAEVVKQLTQRFSVDPSFIKKRIESLIEREYLERDANDRRVYHYLA